MTSHGRPSLHESCVGNAILAERKATFVDLPLTVASMLESPDVFHAYQEIQLPTFVRRIPETQTTAGRVGGAQRLLILATSIGAGKGLLPLPLIWATAFIDWRT